MGCDLSKNSKSHHTLNLKLSPDLSRFLPERNINESFAEYNLFNTRGKSPENVFGVARSGLPQVESGDLVRTCSATGSRDVHPLPHIVLVSLALVDEHLQVGGFENDVVAANL